MIKLRTESSAQTQAVAGALAKQMRPLDLLLLVGEMGAGKTTFTQGFGRALGITGPITSPTFTLMNSYPGELTLHHVDIYRLEHLQEVIDLGLIELLDEGGVALVEWGDMAEPVLPREFLEVKLDVDGTDDDVRLIELRGVGAEWQQREQDLHPHVEQWIANA